MMGDVLEEEGGVRKGGAGRAEDVLVETPDAAGSRIARPGSLGPGLRRAWG